MSTKQKFLQEWWEVNLVHENEKPKVWKRYEAILNSSEVHYQIVEAFDKFKYDAKALDFSGIDRNHIYI